MMRVTKDILSKQADMLNAETGRTDGEKYFVGYECGYANLFLEVGNGRATISYGNTKKELSEKLFMVLEVLQRERIRNE